MKQIVLLGCPPDFQERVVAASGEGLRSRLRRWSEPVARDGTVSGLLTFDPAVVILGEGIGTAEALQVATELDRMSRGIAVMLVAEKKAQTMEAALAAGVRAVLPPDAAGAALRTALNRIVEAADRQVAAQAPAVAAPAASSPTGRVITVTSPKGGAGKTVLASNLAAILAGQAPRRVAVVDLDLQFGDIAFALSLKPKHTIVDIGESVDSTALKVFLTPHEIGLYALCAPGDPAAADDVDPAATPEILSRLAEEFDFVVVDTGAGLTEHTLAALDVSTDAVLMADADVPSIRHLAKVTEALDQVGLTGLRRHAVLNRADARIGIRISDVLDSVGLSMDLEIPTSRDVAISLSRGEPIALSNPKSSMARRVTELAEWIRAGGTEEASPIERSA